MFGLGLGVVRVNLRFAGIKSILFGFIKARDNYYPNSLSFSEQKLDADIINYSLLASLDAPPVVSQDEPKSENDSKLLNALLLQK